MAIKFEKETQRLLIASIKKFAAEHLETDMGELKASLFLEFCMKEIGPTVYNQAIADAQAYLHEKTDDLAAVRHEAEFGFWKR